MAEVYERPVAYEVSVWPEGEESINRHTWSVYVSYRGHGKWAVLVGGENSKRCLDAQGRWDWESIPSERTGEWLASHRFRLEDALALAREHAPKVKRNGKTALEVLAWERSCP